VLGDLLAKHLGECPRYPVPCPNKCGEILVRASLAPHRMVCECGFEECIICGDRVAPGGMVAHRAEKAQLHVELLEAKLSEKEASASQHDGLVQRLARMEDQVKTLAQSAHVTLMTKARADEVKAAVKQQVDTLTAHWRDEASKRLQTKAVWRMKGVDRLLRDYPKEACLPVCRDHN